jgi:excisionase family DNA binding protein
MSVHTKPPTAAVNTPHVSQTWSNQALFTLSQAAQYVICTPRYLQKQIRAGRLRALKPTGKLVRIRRVDLEKFLESGATIGGEQ